MSFKGLDHTLKRPLVFVGLMGAGKTAIGRRTANRLDLPFVDSDAEIEEAAGMKIADIFEQYGETEFRSLERRVLARLLEDKVQIISTGGGAFMDPTTRDVIKQTGLSIWLRADLETLLKRTSRRDTRPLLRTGDPKEILAGLIEKRHPVYETADIMVDSTNRPAEETVDLVLQTVGAYLRIGGLPPEGAAFDTERQIS